MTRNLDKRMMEALDLLEAPECQMQLHTILVSKHLQIMN